MKYASPRFFVVSAALLLFGATVACACGGTVESSTVESSTPVDCKWPPALPSPEGSQCPEGRWLYTDQTCNSYDEPPYICAEVGDMLCHKLCDSDADCADEPCRPRCVEMFLYDGIDACAPAGFSICHDGTYIYC